jgi:ATP-dependent DNA helicase DinG
MRDEINAAGGREVLFVGHLGAEGIVTEVEVHARGNERMVAAPRHACARGDLVIHNHPSGSLRPSDADITVAADLGDDGIGSAIVDNDVTTLYILVEPAPPKRITPLNEEACMGVLEAGGGMEAILPDYIPRESQIQMLRDVVRGFNLSKVVAAEAGTGVGKSFAYLIPAVLWAEQNDERVVIATATINLQQQLLDKDLPLVQRALGTKVPAALVKGRGNYLCPRRLREESEEESLFKEEDVFAAIREWAEDTEIGSRSELPLFLQDSQWSRINSEADTCSVSRCPNRERCFILRARQQAAKARILVVNHHVLFSDLAIRVGGAGWETTALLPPFTRIIFDEAHNVERSATSFFSQQVSRHTLSRVATRLLRVRGAHTFGILNRLRSVVSGEDTLPKAEKALGKFMVAFERLNDELVAFMGTQSTWRLTADTMESLRRAVGRDLQEVAGSTGTLVHALSAIYRDQSDEVLDEPPFPELAALIRRLEAAMEVLEQFAEATPPKDEVLWMELRTDRGGARWVHMIVTPLNVRTIMQDAVFEPHETVVFTSATLTVNGQFQFWGRAIGLPQDEEKLIARVFSSPFDYPRRVIMAVPQDAPSPEHAEYGAFLVRLLPRLVQAAHGGTLILFTSYQQMITLYEAIAPSLEDRGFMCFRQGTDDRARLLHRFREDSSSVLFATDSFWEGVDMPGDTLRLVVICRLPFRVPTDPVQLARAELIEGEGGNAFNDLSLPQAIIRLKQGFGRLMRRADDYGVVVVTDARLIKKYYGRMFWNSLPPAQPIVEPGEALTDTIREFISRMSKR